MPQTAFVFLVGCVAISALPPLNGFVSEWLTFQAILLSPQLPSWGLKLLVPAVGALLALSAALAAACFVKAFGVTFLGRPRTPRGRSARPKPTAFRSPRCSFWRRFACSPAFCPALFIDALAPVVRRLSASACRRRSARHGSRSCRSPRAAAPITACWFLCSCLCLARSRHSPSTAWPRDRLRRAPAWDCGYPDASPATQYTAGSFAQPIRRVFGTIVFRAREQVDMPPPGDTRPARLQRRTARSRSGRRSTRRLRPASASPPTASTSCSS